MNLHPQRLQMKSKHYAATFDEKAGRYYFTYPGGRSSGWLHQVTCQREADSFKRAHRALGKRTPLDLKPCRDS